MSSKATALSGRRESSMITPASSPTEPCALSLPALVAELRAEVAALRDSLAGEVRTRRLVVVDEDGAERVIAETCGSIAEVMVLSPPNAAGQIDSAVLSAYPGGAGIAVEAAGNIVVGMDGWSEPTATGNVKGTGESYVRNFDDEPRDTIADRG